MKKVKKTFYSDLKKAKLRLLKLHYESNTGHIGGNFSSIDALMTIYHHLMDKEDKFILSKGHSAGALYITLWSKKLIEEKDLNTFSKDNSVLPGHPSGSSIPGLLFSTGSLGHGPPLAAGLALAERFKKTKNKIYCLCSDGEWQEGACWEFLIFAVHHKLDNLTIYIDQNCLQGFGSTDKIVSYSDIESRLKAFDANVQSVDGHSPESILDASNNIKKNKLNIIILNTIKGKDISFEGLLESHYLPLSDKQYKEASKKLNKLYS
jgi:transketolase